MKKIVMFFILILIGVSLSGCDFLNQGLQGTNEDFCVDNPDDPICLELITFDENDTVDELFTNLYDHFSINDDFCELYIDSNNPLYDACLESKDVLFPEDLNGYVMVENPSNILDGVEYQVVFENQALQQRVIFTFVLNIDETILSISKWEYKVEELLSEEDLDKVDYYQGFIIDYYSKRISNDTFDQIYEFDTYLGLSTFYDVRLSMNETAYTVSFKEAIEVEENVYLVSYDLILNGTVVDTMKDYVFLDYNNDSEFYIYIIDPIHFSDHQVNEDLFIIFSDLLNYIGSPNFNIDEMHEKYYFNNDDIMTLVELLSDASSYSIDNVTFDNMLQLIMSFDINGEELVFIILFNYYEEIDEYEIIIDFIGDEQRNDFSDLFNAFLSDLESQMYTKQELLDKYFVEGAAPIKLIEMIYDGFEFDYIRIDDQGNYFYITFKLESEVLFYEIYFDDSDVLFMSFTEKDYILDRETIMMMLQDFSNVLQDDPTAACDTYFENSSECLEYFLPYYGSNIDIEHIIYRENYNTVLANVYNYDFGSFMIDIDFIVKETSSNNFVFELVNTPLRNEEITSLITEFMSTINNGTSEYSMFQDIIDNQYILELDYLNSEYGNYYAIFDVYNQDSDFVTSRLVRFEELDNQLSLMYVEDIRVLTLENDEEELETTLNMLVDKYNDYSISTEDFCTEYQGVFINCNDMRNHMMNDERVLRFNGLAYFRDTETLEAHIAIMFDNNIEGMIEMPIIIVEGINGYEILPVYYKLFETPIEVKPVDYEALYSDFESFLNDLLNETVTEEQIINTYSMFDVYDFVQNRDLLHNYISASINLKLSYHSNVVVTFVDDLGNENVVEYNLQRVDEELFTINPFDKGINQNDYFIIDLEEKLNNPLLTDDSILEIPSPYDDTVSLYQYLHSNNYVVNVEYMNGYTIRLFILDEEGTVVVDVDYDYYFDVNILGETSYSIKVASIYNIYNEQLRQYLSELESSYYNGEIDINELNQYTEVLSFIPESYNTLYMEIIDYGYEEFDVLEGYEFSIRYEVDGLTYYSSHTVTYVKEWDSYVWTLNGYYSPNVDGDIATPEVSMQVLQEFLNDLYDFTVTKEEITEKYFNKMAPPFIFESREYYVDDDYDFVVTSITEISDDDELLYYRSDVEIRYNGEIENGEIDYVVYVLEDGSYFILLDL